MEEVTYRVYLANQVLDERSRQDSKWGGPDGDLIHTPLDWHAMISDYNSWARRMRCMGSTGKARNRYIQTAAICLAAVEALDKETGDIF